MTKKENQKSDRTQEMHPSHVKAVIMAGGSGTRLWPVSRKKKPKQFQAIVSNKTMLQETFMRLRKRFPIENIYISTNAEYVEEVESEIIELPRTQIIAEPVARGTASSVALTVATVLAHDQNALIAMFPSDHIVKHEDVLHGAVERSISFLSVHPDTTITFGIIPDYPETGYGYIKQATTDHREHHAGIYDVDRFVEKPDMETAQKYIADGQYHWNAGMYVYSARAMQEKFDKYVPDTAKRLTRLMKSVDTEQYEGILAREYPLMDKIGFEYAIVENDRDVVVIPLDLGWSDVGSWAALKDALQGDAKANFARGEHFDVGSENLLVYGSKKLITTIGLKDLIIVDTEDAILICDRNQSQAVSDVVKKLEGKTSSITYN